MLSESQIESLSFLNDMKKKTVQLKHHIDQIQQLKKELEKEESLLQDYQNEKESLLSERDVYLNYLKTVQADITTLDKLIEKSSLRKERMLKSVDTICNDEYFPLKESLDAIRASRGLGRLPSLQELDEKDTHDYLQMRLQNWKKDESTEERKVVKKSRTKRKSIG